MGTFRFDSDHPLKAAYYTLGCKLNYAETSTIAGKLRSVGVEQARRGETPDICIINTCSVTGVADKKARTLIRRITRDYPQAFIVVTGCYAQLKPLEIAAIKGVDLVLGTKEKLSLPDFISDTSKLGEARVKTSAIDSDTAFSPSCSRGERTRFFLKVQDGCDYFCTYCTIPFARGRSRSGQIASLVAQAEEAAAQGGREIVLTGVNIGDFGKNTGESFFDLLKALDKVEGIQRFRISSIEPNLLTDEILHWIATESRAYMPHFHIPLQSGSDDVLKKMNRRYDTAFFARRIEMIRSLIPDAFIGVDIIAGARGETDKAWKESYEFVSSLDISRLHVFPYSERPGTTALHLDQPVSPEERDVRAARLSTLSDTKIITFMTANKGKLRKVLWESDLEKKGESGVRLMSGLTDNYIRVVAPLKPELLNNISTVRLEDIDASRIETMTASHI